MFVYRNDSNEFIVDDSKYIIQIIYIQMIINKCWCETYITYPVSETNFMYVVFVSWKIEAFNHIICQFYLFQNGLIDLQTPKGWHLFKKK